jgi:hypothetical protein
MTAYAVSTSETNAGTSAISLFVSPGTYEIRIPQIVFSYQSNAFNEVEMTGTVGYYTSGMSGGSSVGIGPMRQGSPATTATASTGASGSGTFYSLGTYLNGQYTNNSIGPNNAIIPGVVLFAGSYTFTPPFDLILSPGTALATTLTADAATGGADAGGTLDINIFFEELRLSWHY